MAQEVKYKFQPDLQQGEKAGLQSMLPPEPENSAPAVHELHLPIVDDELERIGGGVGRGVGYY